eukprot:5343338-Alexandrium_andersonii.AAC.1
MTGPLPFFPSRCANCACASDASNLLRSLHPRLCAGPQRERAPHSAAPQCALGALDRPWTGSLGSN